MSVRSFMRRSRKLQVATAYIDSSRTCMWKTNIWRWILYIRCVVFVSIATLLSIFKCESSAQLKEIRWYWWEVKTIWWSTINCNAFAMQLRIAIVEIRVLFLLLFLISIVNGIRRFQLFTSSHITWLCEVPARLRKRHEALFNFAKFLNWFTARAILLYDLHLW